MFNTPTLGGIHQRSDPNPNEVKNRIGYEASRFVSGPIEAQSQGRRHPLARPLKSTSIAQAIELRNSLRDCLGNTVGNSLVRECLRELGHKVTSSQGEYGLRGHAQARALGSPVGPRKGPDNSPA